VRRWNVATAVLVAGLLAVGARAELPWYGGVSRPSEYPPPGCPTNAPDNPSLPMQRREAFSVGCVDARTGTPVECLARFRTWFSLDEVPSDARIRWLGAHDHDRDRVAGPFSRLVGGLWSLLDPREPAEDQESFGGRTGRRLWPAMKLMPTVAGIVRLRAEYFTLDPNWRFVDRWPWRVDPVDGRREWLEMAITVEEPGLVELPSDESLYVRCGSTASCTGTDNVEPEHPAAFYGLSELIRKVRRLARDFRDQWGMILTVTDMTLEWGGLFDYQETWTPPHSRHRRGRSVDISRTVWEDTPQGRVRHRMTAEQEKWLRHHAQEIGFFRVPEAPIHFELRPVEPLRVCSPAGWPIH